MELEKNIIQLKTENTKLITKLFELEHQQLQENNKNEIKIILEENILKFIRWDVMWRVTHRDNPKAYKWMMTFGFNFNF